MSVSKIALSLALALAFAPVAQAADAPPLTKADVETIVHDYLVANPKVMLDSVNAYQAQQMAEQSKVDAENAKAGIVKNKESLAEDKTSPWAGNEKGDVTLVEFFDYNCHFCKGAFPSVQGLLEKDKNLKIVFKEFPILGPTSETAAKWALAAQKQGKHYEFHKAMMNNKDQISDDLLAKVAKDIGMDVEKAKADAAAPETQATIEKNRDLANTLGIRGTPAFIVGDNLIPGAVPESDIAAKIKSVRDAAAKK